MGKLIRLELFSMYDRKMRRRQYLTLSLDFKSYKGHHVLLFGDAYFTSIIGPNGSGKSNS
jgi:Chromosome segregation ATPases